MHRSAVVFACVLLSACGERASMAPVDAGVPVDDASWDASMSPPLEHVPCAVREVLSAHCLDCHDDPPRYGAPRPLRRLEDFRGATSDGTPLSELVLSRIHEEGTRRMPPASQAALDPDDLAALTDWLSAGAPESPEVCEELPPPPCSGPACLPCMPDQQVLAGGDGPEGAFHVPAGNPYRCFAFQPSLSQAARATAWAPVIDNAALVHHWILYRSPTPPSDAPNGDCQMPREAVGLMGWAPGAEGVVLPDDVGLALTGSPDDWLILQVHYWNPRGVDAYDRSGVAFCTTEQTRAYTAGILTLGTTAIGIAPRAHGQEIVATCPSSSTLVLSGPLEVLAATPHMHELGQSVRTDILRAGSDAARETVVRVEPWSFDDQAAHWLRPPVEIRPGDALETHCVYDNPSSDWVYFGERTEDEMCFDFLLVYPLESIPRAYAPTCLSALGS